MLRVLVNSDRAYSDGNENLLSSAISLHDEHREQIEKETSSIGLLRTAEDMLNCNPNPSR